jgi:signal transduction histidine kinase
MEAVGRLAGGVAHDFNNLLTAISTNADLALGALASGQDVGEELGQIKRAADRATALTRQLLAFSRKQMLEPRLLDINAVVREAGDFLSRLSVSTSSSSRTSMPIRGRSSPSGAAHRS